MLLLVVMHCERAAAVVARPPFDWEILVNVHSMPFVLMAPEPYSKTINLLNCWPN